MAPTPPARHTVSVKRSSRSYTLPVLGEWTLLLLLLGGLLVVIHVFTPFKRIESSLFDATQAFWERPPPEDVILVAIDEDSLAVIGRWPWRRAIHAALLERLRPARAVALDILLAEADERDSTGDQILARAIREQGRVALPLSVEARAGVLTLVRPLTPFADAAASLGHIHLELDEDGIGRRIYLYEGLGEDLFPHFAIALMRAAGASAALPDTGSDASVGTWIRKQAWLIPFIGKPGHFRRVPYVSVLRGDYPPGFFANKLVLVGATATGLGDAYPTPVSGRSSAMPGIEIHANILDGLRRGDFLTEITPGAASGLNFVLLLVSMLAYLWLSPRASLLLTLGGASAIVIGAAALLRVAQVWLPPVTPVIVLMLAYPLWSWRRLEATQRYMEEELSRFVAEPEWLPATVTEKPPARFAPDVIARRIDEVREATARLRRMRRLVADTLDSLPEAALLIDRRGRIVLANPKAAEYCGASGVAEMLDTDLHASLLKLQGPSASPLEDLIQEVLAGGDAAAMELSGRSGRLFMVGLAPCVSEAAGIAGAIVSVADITALREEERQRRELMRFLTHDIRAPQAAILTLLDAVGEGTGPPETDELIRRIRQFAGRALELSDNLFKFLQAERLDPEQFTELDLGGLLAEAVDEHLHAAAAKGITLEFDLPDSAMPMRGNRTLLARAVGNLLDNAIKYSPARTRVALSARSTEDFWRVMISDQGYGFEADQLPLAFHRHRRFHTESHPHIPGTGLGLAFTKLVVDRHSGKIRLTSQPGIGTIVEMDLPRSPVI